MGQDGVQCPKHAAKLIGMAELDEASEVADHLEHRSEQDGYDDAVEEPLDGGPATTMSEAQSQR